MKRLLTNILILIVAILLLGTIGVFGLVWSLVYSLFKIKENKFLKYWGDIFFSINVGIDKIGNVLLGSFLNTFVIKNVKNTPELFGTVHRTISQVLSLNEKENNVTGFGNWIISILELLDPGHMENCLKRL